MPSDHECIMGVVDSFVSAVDRAFENHRAELSVREVGHVVEIGSGIALVDGLPGAQSEELLQFSGNRLGMVFNLDPDKVGVILMDSSEDIEAGDRVMRTGRVMDVPVGESLLGRVVDATGRPLDGKGPIRTQQRLPIERPARAILQRAPVEKPLQTGVKVIDALIPIGRGQRELIVGDRQTGKTAIALDTIINQKGREVICFYCAIGQRSSAVARVIADLHEHGAMDYCTVVVSTGDDPVGLRFAAPYAATTMAEYFMEQGRDVLVVYDDLTRHARSYRELSLLLRRPPGREAYPGDIFYVHARLLERATHLNEELGGGSLTALPIVETHAQNISAYIPTNLISITDGQVYLSPQLFRQGVLPAVDVGKSVSRVGGKAQLPAYRAVAGDLRLAYSQFEELERFSRYGTRMDEETRRTLEHGRRIREVLKQPQYEPLEVARQIASLLAASEGLLDELPVERIAAAESALRQAVSERSSDLAGRIEAGEELSEDGRRELRKTAKAALDSQGEDPDNGNA